MDTALKLAGPALTIVIAGLAFYATARLVQYRVGVLEKWREEIDEERQDLERWRGKVDGYIERADDR